MNFQLRRLRRKVGIKFVITPRMGKAMRTSEVLKLDVQNKLLDSYLKTTVSSKDSWKIQVQYSLILFCFMLELCRERCVDVYFSNFGDSPNYHWRSTPHRHNWQLSDFLLPLGSARSPLNKLGRLLIDHLRWRIFSHPKL